MNPFRLHHEVRQQVITSFMCTLILGGLSAVFFVLAQPLLPLFYSLALPQQQLVPKVWIFLLPSISLAISISHALILSVIEQQERIIQRLFISMTLVLQALLVIALIRIIYITW